MNLSTFEFMIKTTSIFVITFHLLSWPYTNGHTQALMPFTGNKHNKKEIKVHQSALLSKIKYSYYF